MRGAMLGAAIKYRNCYVKRAMFTARCCGEKRVARHGTVPDTTPGTGLLNFIACACLHYGETGFQNPRDGISIQ